MKEQIVETWHINNRVNLLLLQAIRDDALTCSLSPRGGGTVVQQFSHLHNMRLLRLERYAPDFMQGQCKIEKKNEVDTALLSKRLSESGDAFGAWIAQVVENDGKPKGFKRGVIAMLGYMISHESHHRGNIMLTLKQCGHKVPKEVAYGIWAWNQI